ncbi:uncharacterized protein MELLADRAFT_72584 [Melampsora larici-populina 98AG31]|uniref:Extracellular serine-rich protein n=1 Tax=Melampsora larici-populina (strain 98AG31 / pathotype 3-4-7) TaxID=747676 RepID=F4RW73_MELLP|nr:uncharacterized protein MELLADRAFT_72584 [Melampsora larici-populina 98AG31]EGG03233.1 hypothetical protein MELLADRAFT_72584 [Melampsora larici-populina 98AG31]
MLSLAFATCALVISHALAADYRVTLGISQLTGQVGVGFDPNRILPVAGDTITFTWSVPSYINNPPTGSYSATQGSYGSPCQPMAGGFDSGPRTTAAESSGSAPSMVFQVKDTQPLYFYSSVGDQCKQGMVLGVNSAASGDGSVESYIIAAGGNPYPDTGNSSSTTTTTTTTPASTTTNTSATMNMTHSMTNSTSNSTMSHNSTTASTNARPSSATGIIVPQALVFMAGLISALVL